MKLLKGILVGGVLISTGQIFAQQVFAQQAVAETDTSSEIRLLKAKLKQLELRVEDQGRTIHVLPEKSATRASR